MQFFTPQSITVNTDFPYFYIPRNESAYFYILIGSMPQNLYWTRSVSLRVPITSCQYQNWLTLTVYHSPHHILYIWHMLLQYIKFSTTISITFHHPSRIPRILQDVLICCGKSEGGCTDSWSEFVSLFGSWVIYFLPYLFLTPMSW